MKCIKTVATELLLLAQICTKSFVGWGFAPDPTGGAYSAPQTPSWFRGGTPLPRGRGGKGKGEVSGIGIPPPGTGREGKEMEGRMGWERVGKGRGRRRRGGRGNKHTRFKTCGAAHVDNEC